LLFRWLVRVELFVDELVAVLVITFVAMIQALTAQSEI
jgi:hypothetical protein